MAMVLFEGWPTGGGMLPRRESPSQPVAVNPWAVTYAYGVQVREESRTVLVCAQKEVIVAGDFATVLQGLQKGRETP